MTMEQSLVPAVAARPESRLAGTSPRAIGISFRHLARMPKLPLSGFGKPPKPTLNEVALVSLVNWGERPGNLVLSHAGSKRDISIPTGA